MVTHYSREHIGSKIPTTEGHEFSLGTWLDDYPYLHYKLDSATGEADGIAFEMMDAMAPWLDYTYTYTNESYDFNWGDFVNGSWNGMLGMVHSMDYDFTVNYFMITGERSVAFDASTTYWMEGFGLALLTPRPLAKWRNAYYPFTPEVWGVLAGILVLAVFLMYWQDRLQPEPFMRTFHATWANLACAMVSQSVPRLPKSLWQRVFVGAWLLYGFILVIAYTANLIAFLTIPVFPQRIETVEQLAKSDKRVSMCDYGEFVPGALRSSKDPYYRAIGNRLDLFRYPDYDTPTYLLRKGTHAFIESYLFNMILIFADYEVKDSYMLKEQVYPGHLCWYFKKNTPWKHKFDLGLRRLVEAGLVPRWIKLKTEDFMGRDFERRQILAAKETRLTALTLEHLQGVFLIYLFINAFAVFVFFLEVLSIQMGVVSSVFVG
ncbi:ionotropic receptor 21a-like isoform X2 [Oratosquilla oratoria]|uniref:ionotropic receptor 21a-like isoform X2 n=1 Tax=Oratosquilla oratoria TaxID=337810 RepID=UPI003F775E8A